VYKWEEAEVERKKLLRNICEYDYIIDQPAPIVTGQLPNSTKEGQNPGSNSSSFLPKLTSSSIKANLNISSDKKKSFGPLQTAGLTSMGPFYKQGPKRGFAQSQLEMRRDSNKSNTTGDIVNN